MDIELPDNLKDEQRALEAEIREAFRGVDRDWAISWSASEVIDLYGSAEEIAAAAKMDKEKSWEELIDDPAWNHEPGTGGFSFLDPVGFRYYMAPAMVRCSRCGYGEFVGYALAANDAWHLEKLSLFNSIQSKATAHFVRFMIKVHADRDDSIYGESWEEAYQDYWRKWDEYESGA